MAAKKTAEALEAVPKTAPRGAASKKVVGPKKSADAKATSVGDIEPMKNIAAPKASTKKAAATKAGPTKSAAKTTAVRSAAKTTAARKSTSAAKASPRKPSVKTSGPPSVRRPISTEATTLRGRALAELVIERLRGPESPVGEPMPLSADQLLRCEQTLGVALSPFMHALFSFDIGWLSREFDMFDAAGSVLVKSCFAVIAEHAGVCADLYDPWCKQRFTGKACRLDGGADSMRFVYFGAPDAHGEYPVLCIDHDDMPILGVQYEGFDLWAADMLGIPVPGRHRAARRGSQRLLGTADDWEAGMMELPDFARLPYLEPGPRPGTVMHETPPVSSPFGAQPALSPTQIPKALKEHARAGRLARLKQLIPHASSDALDAALVEAGIGKQRACMEALLTAGADPDASDYYGATVTHLVTSGGDVELVRMLLDAGASPDGRGVNGETVLFEAIERGDEAISQLLIERDADVNHLASNEMSPLHEAVRTQKDPRFIDILCEAGADPNGFEKQRPPLFWAIQEGSLAHVERLLAHGAEVNVRSSFDQRTPLHAAFAEERDEIAQLLIQAGAERGVADDSGMVLTDVFGPDGSDTRPVLLRYAPSAEPQRLTVTVKLAVTNRFQAEKAIVPALRAEHWCTLVSGGAAAEDVFDPSASSATVTLGLDTSGLSQGGMHTRTFELEVRAVSLGFVAAMCKALLGRIGPLRVVGIDVKGTKRAKTLDRDALDALVGPKCQPGLLPFELVERQAGEPCVVIIPVGGKSSVLEGLFATAMTAWLSLLDRVPTQAPKTPHLMSTSIVQPFDWGLRTLLFDALAMVPAKEPFRLPCGLRDALAQLGQVMRRVHAEAPLAKVELWMPR